MRREQLSRVFCNLEERQIAEAYQFDPDLCGRSPGRIVHMKKKRIITFALAAALILSLSISAYAMYNNIATPQAAENVAREQIQTWQELGILSADLVFEGSADDIVELEEEYGGTSWYGRFFPHSYDVRWYFNFDGRRFGCNLNVDTLEGKIQTATIFAAAGKNAVPTGEISLDMGNGEKQVYYYYENFSDLLPTDLTVDSFCSALASYWGYEGYRLADKGDEGYTEEYHALYADVDGSTRMVDLPRNKNGNCFLMVYFDGDQERAPVYFDLTQYPGYVGIDIGIRHPVG